MQAIDNSVAITVNGGGLNANNIFQLEGAAGAGEIFLEFSSDNAAMTSPASTNSNGLPRLRVFINNNGLVRVQGSRNTTSTALEDMQPRDGSSFNTISFLGASNSFSVVNQDGTGTDAISGTAYVFSACDADGDGLEDYCDIDSDNDGIADIVEAGGTDSDNDGREDTGTDVNNDGFPDAFDTNLGGTALTDGDKDGDGFENRIDLDSDGDGIADIIEAGGTDADNDGQADTSTDTDNDGWSNEYDSDNGGTALTITDLDGDGNANYLDLDSDSDGITDNVEGQTTISFLAPLGTDTDQDGWDNRYDSDDGGTAITLSNNESAGNVDYLDDDSDGDGLVDWIEGFDDNNSGDALDDLILRATNFETAAGNPMFYVNSDDGDMDGIPDWLEDADIDGIPNFLDPDNALYQDTDNDGLVDLFDADNSGTASATPDGDGDGEYDFRDTDNQISLPITLVYFTAKKVGDIVQLNWETSSEINNDYFTVERSSDGTNFLELFRRKGAGNSNTSLSYVDYDNNPMKGINYYRLRQTDYNGTSTTFNIVPIFFGEGNTQMRIYPNPTNGEQLFLEIENPVVGEHLINIRTLEGQFIKSVQINAEEELIYLEKELLTGIRLAKGTYIIEVNYTNGRKAFKFIVQ